MGFPIRTSSDQRLIDNSPRLNAALHVLHRPSMPRHPPCALTNKHHTHKHTQKVCAACAATKHTKQKKIKKLHHHHTHHLKKIGDICSRNARVHYTVLTQHYKPHTPHQHTNTPAKKHTACTTGNIAPETQQRTNTTGTTLSSTSSRLYVFSSCTHSTRTTTTTRPPIHSSPTTHNVTHTK